MQKYTALHPSPVTYRNNYLWNLGWTKLQTSLPAHSCSLTQTLYTYYPSEGSKSHPHITRQIQHHTAGARRGCAVLNNCMGSEQSAQPISFVQCTEISCTRSTVFAFLERGRQFPKPFCKINSDAKQTSGMWGCDERQQLDTPFPPLYPSSLLSWVANPHLPLSHPSQQSLVEQLL